MSKHVEAQYDNHYYHCGVRWDDEWECMSNDECPVCKAEIEPYASTELKSGELVIHAKGVFEIVPTDQVTRTFSSRDAATAFVQGVEFVNDSAVDVRSIIQLKSGEFMVVMTDEDAGE